VNKKVERKNLSFDLTDKEQKEAAEFLALFPRDQSRVISFIIARFLREMREKGVEINNSRTAKIIKMMFNSPEDAKIMAALGDVGRSEYVPKAEEFKTHESKLKVNEAKKELETFAPAQKSASTDDEDNMNQSLLDQLNMF